MQGYKPEVKEKNVPDKTSRYKSSYHSNSPTIEEDLSCYICCEACTESEHTATAGPGGSKVIQYFLYKLFVENTPAERLAILREKGLCIQCLNKHILVYDEHKHLNENKELLETY